MGDKQTLAQLPSQARSNSDSLAEAIERDPVLGELVDDARAFDVKLLAKAGRAANLRQAREDGWPEGIALLARALILAGLPLKRTKEKQIVHKVREAEGTMTVVFGVVGERAELPFGNDVNVLHYLFDHLNETKPGEFFVQWSTAADYFRWWDMDEQSPTNQRDLRQRWHRLSNLVVQITYENPRTGEMLKQTRALFPKVYLPSSIDARPVHRDQMLLPGHEHGVWVEPELARQFARRAPVPKELLRAYPSDCIERRLAIYLGLRTFAAKSESVIPWADLAATLGSSDRKTRMLKLRVRQALSSLKLWWPELEADIVRQGLRVRPPKDGRHLLLDGASRRVALSPCRPQ